MPMQSTIPTNSMISLAEVGYQRYPSGGGFCWAYTFVCSAMCSKVCSPNTCRKASNGEASLPSGCVGPEVSWKTLRVKGLLLDVEVWPELEVDVDPFDDTWVEVSVGPVGDDEPLGDGEGGPPASSLLSSGSNPAPA